MLFLDMSKLKLIRGEEVKKILRVGILFLISSFLSSLTPSFAQSSLSNGLSWLSSNQNADGSFGDVIPTRDTTEVVDTLNSFNSTGAEYQKAINWIANVTTLNNDALARKIYSLALSGEDVSNLIADLISFRTTEGGWGLFSDEIMGDPLTTVLVLHGLRASNYSDQNIISHALGFLLSTQNLDGGWGFYPSACSNCEADPSNVYMTATVLQTFSQFRTVYDLETPINSGVTYLLTKQNPDGGFGSSPSTVYETALALLALIESGQEQAQPLQNAINYLTSTQLPNGSWDDDPYSTALALRALANVKPNLSIFPTDITFSNPNPKIGDTITITATIYNEGPANADNVLVQFFDGDPSAGGILFGETTITSIPAFGSSQASISWTIPTASARKVFIRIDPLNAIDELDEIDNITSNNLTSATLPDLSITPADITFNSTFPMPGDVVTITAIIRNKGEIAAENVSVDIYEGDPSAGGTKLGSSTFSSIAAGDLTTLQLTSSFLLGIHSIYVVTDPAHTILEGDEGNNTALKVLQVGGGFIDLSITGNDISFSPASPIAGNIVLINATIHNLGDTQADNVPIRLYIGNPSSGGTQIGPEISIPLISAQSSFSVITTWDSKGHAGNNDIYLWIDPSNSINEPYRQNNIAYKTLAVGTSSGPDLTITSSDITFSPQAPLEGEFVIITANIKNNGTVDAERVFVECSITDPTDGASFVIGSHIIPLLPAAGTSAIQMTMLTQGLSGTYEIYFNVDPSNTIIETNEANNTAHKPITVTSPLGPDLITSSVDISGVSSNPQTLTILGNVLAVIKNRGNQETASPFVLTAFEDRDKNYAYDPGVDNVVGQITHSNNLTPNGTDTVIIPVSGTTLFLDSPIYLLIDSGNTITETDETNNISCIPIFTACRNSKVDKAIKSGALWLIDHQLNIDSQGTMKAWAADNAIYYNALAIKAYQDTERISGTKYENIMNKVVQMRAPNGGWYDTVTTSHVILSLLQAGINRDSQIIQDAVSWLIRQQRQDGDWRTSLPAKDTGLAIIALIKAGLDKSEPCIQKAVQWLTNNQNSDGYWGDYPGVQSNIFIDTYSVIGLALATSPTDPRVLRAKNWYNAIKSTHEFTMVSWLRMVFEIEPNNPDILTVATTLYNMQMPDGGWRTYYSYPYSSFQITADSLSHFGRLGFSGARMNNGILWVERHINLFWEGFPEEKSIHHTDWALDALQAAKIDDSANRNGILKGRKTIVNSQSYGGNWGGGGIPAVPAPFTIPAGRSIFALSYFGSISLEEQTAVNRGINFLVNAQWTDGGWATYQGYTASDLLATTDVLLGLLQSGLTSTHPAVLKGLSYLILRQETDGSFGGFDINVNAAIIFKLAGLNYKTYFDKTIAWIKSKQGASGGWGNTGATSLALIALSFAGDSGIEVAKGVFWLLAAQNQDGGWSPTIGVPMSGNADTSLAVWALSLAKFSLAVDLDASVERQNYCPNDMVKITVTTEQPPEDITLEGSVTYQGGGSYPLTFNLVAGVFEAEFNIPDGTLPGTGTVQVTGRATYGYGVDVVSFNIRNCSLMKPDVAITDADLKESLEDPGNPDLRTILATIKNLGEADANNVLVHFYRGSPVPENLIDCKTIPNISIFGSSTITLSYTLSEDALITVVVDPDNTIAETLENNNLAAIQLTRRIPDLSISPSDVTILPPNTIEGQSAIITAIVHNIGNLGASNVNLSFYDGDPQNGGTLIGAKAILDIDSGATAFVEMPWDTFGQSGINYVHVVIDPYNVIAESNENNNSTLVSVDVTPPSKPDLAITSSDIAFSSANPNEGELLTINATVHNLGLEVGNVDVSLYDGDPSAGGIFLAKISNMLDISFGERVTVSFNINTIGLSGDHKFFISIDPDNGIDEMLETNNIALNLITIAQSGLSLGILTDKSTYTANEDVQITVNLNNLINSSRAGTLEVRILDGNNNLVVTVSSQALNLGANEATILTYTWNTGQTLSSGYKVACQFSEGGNVISRAEAPIAITPVKNVSSGVAADKISYQANQVVTITSTITSLSPNYIFNDLTSRITLTNSQGAVLLTDAKTIPILTPNQRTELKTYWNTMIYLKGPYTVTLEIFNETLLISTSQTFFTITGSSETVSGLKGTISVSQSPISQGLTEALTYSISNNGNEDMTGLNVRILIVNPETQEIKDRFESTVNLPMNITLSGNFIASTSTLTPRTYLVILQVSSATMTQPKSLASTFFEVIPGLEITKTIPDKVNLLVWINDKCDHHPQQKGVDCQEPKPHNCIRVDLLENILTEAGVNYYIVYNTHDIENEMRNPLYTDFMILGDHEPLTDHYGAELREQVYSGKGLFSALYLKHGQCFEDDYEQLFGLTYRGQLPWLSYYVNLPESPLSEPISFEAEGKALRVDVDDPGRIMGWIEWQRSHQDHPSLKEYPGIVVNQYGGGKAIFFAFDFGSTLNEENYDALSVILKNALSYIHSPIDTVAVSPYQFVPVMLSLKSLGGAFDLRIRETYPEELKLYDPAAGEWITDNPWFFDIQLDADETKTILCYTLASDQPGTYLLQTDAEYLENGNYLPYQSLSVTITIEQDSVDMTQEILNSLRAIQVTRMSDKAAIKNAMMFIERVQDRGGDSHFDVEKNILDILKAIESLLFVTSKDISNIRMMMDELLKIWEARAYLSPPLPPHYFRQNTE